MQAFLISALLLAVFVAGGVVAIVVIRGRYRRAEAGAGSWETALAEYRALRDKGVLTADEYRKVAMFPDGTVRVPENAALLLGIKDHEANRLHAEVFPDYSFNGERYVRIGGGE